MTDILALDATGQLQALEARRISAVELLNASIARHESWKTRLNAVVNTDIERARHRAQIIDDQRAKGEPMGALAGLPMTIKDTLEVEGMCATSGLAAFQRRTVSDAIVVSRVKAQGAVIWGKTNVPVLAGDFQTYNSLFGTTNNPWDLERTPGGSSGGAAACLATGITPLEIGSDIGGSLRTPANFCGVFSHKPTWGLVPQQGHVPPPPGAHSEPDLNVIGPMARSARDLRLLLSILEDGPLAAKAPPAELKDLKIGLWCNEPAFYLDPEVCTIVESLGLQLSGRGALVDTIASPVNATHLVDSFVVLLLSLLGSGLPTGPRNGFEALRGAAKLARKMGAGSFSWAAMTLAYTARHRDWLIANEARAGFQARMREVFLRYDVIIAPINPVPAFPHDHSAFATRTLRLSDGRKIPYPAMLQWISLATACGLPATAIPVSQTASGLPVGVQIIGPRGGDSKTLAVAQAIEEALGGFMAPPTGDI